MQDVSPGALRKLRGSSIDIRSTEVILNKGAKRAFWFKRSLSACCLSNLQISSALGKCFFFFFSLVGCGGSGRVRRDASGGRRNSSRWKEEAPWFWGNVLNFRWRGREGLGAGFAHVPFHSTSSGSLLLLGWFLLLYCLSPSQCPG